MSRQNNAERLKSRYQDNGNQLDIRFRPRQASDEGLSHASASREIPSILTTKRSTNRPVEMKSSSHVSITPPLGAACESLGSNEVVGTVDDHRDRLSRPSFWWEIDTVNSMAIKAPISFESVIKIPSEKIPRRESRNLVVSGSECEHDEVFDHPLTRRNDDNHETKLLFAKRHRESSFRSDMGAIFEDSECGIVPLSPSISEEDLASVRLAERDNGPESVPRLLSTSKFQDDSCNSTVTDSKSELPYEYVFTKTSQMETSSVTMIDSSSEHVPRYPSSNEQLESSCSLPVNDNGSESVCEHIAERSQEKGTNCFQSDQMTELHTCVPYLWLVHRNGSWCTMHNNREIEEAFCNGHSVLFTKQLDVRLFGFLLCLALMLAVNRSHTAAR
jgi:hypothetical protein